MMEQETGYQNYQDSDDDGRMVFNAIDPSGVRSEIEVEQVNNKPKNRKALNTLKMQNLTNPNTGLSSLYNLTTKFKSDIIAKSKVNPVSGMTRFLKIAREWAFQLNPKYEHEYLLERIAKLGTESEIRDHMNTLRDIQSKESENQGSSKRLAKMHLQSNTELFATNETLIPPSTSEAEGERVKPLRSSTKVPPKFDDQEFRAIAHEEPDFEIVPDMEDMYGQEALDEMMLPIDFMGGNVEPEDLEYSFKKKKKLTE